MKRIILSLVAAAATLLPSLAMAKDAPSKIKGNGVIVTRNQAFIDTFTDLNVATCINLVISDRTDGDIVISADENIMPLVKVSITNGIFKAWIDGDYTHRTIKKSSIKVEIPAHSNIRNIRAAGASSIKIIPTISSEQVNFTLSKAARIEAKVRTNHLMLNLTEGSSAELDIETDGLKINISGGSSISPINALCKECEITAREAGKVAGVMTTTNIKCEASGASNILLSGVARTANFDISGTSRLSAPNFITDHCTVRAADASYAYVNCGTAFTGDSTNNSQIICTGECTITTISDPISKR